MCVADLGRQPQLAHARPARRRRSRRPAPDAPRRRGVEPGARLRGAVRRAPAARSRGGGPDPLRRDDARARAPAAQRLGQLRALAAAGARCARRSPGWARRCRQELPQLAGAGQAPLCELAVGAGRRGGRALPVELARDARVASRAAPRAPTPTRRMRRGARATPTRPTRSPAARSADAGPIRRRAQPRADSRSACAALSYSSLTELERCGYRYYLERVLGLAEDRVRRAERPPARRPGGARARHARASADGVVGLLRSDERRPPQDVGGRRPRARPARRRAGARASCAALIAAALQADPAARVAARASRCVASTRSPSRSARSEPLITRRDRSARDRARRLAPGARLQERPGRAGCAIWASWSSATTRSSDCSTRSRSCAKARWRSRSCTGSWSARSGSRARYAAADRLVLEEQLAAAHRASARAALRRQRAARTAACA